MFEEKIVGILYSERISSKERNSLFNTILLMIRASEWYKRSHSLNGSSETTQL